MGKKVRIGVTRDLFDDEGKFIIPGPGLKLLDKIPNVEYEAFAEFLPEATAEQIRDLDMVIALRPKWTRRTVMGNTRLLAIHRTGVGYDMVDVAAMTDANVMLCITPKAVRRPMATAIITFILGLSMRLLTKDRLAREGRWADKAQYHGYGLVGKTLGSIGVGNIGREMFMLAKPLGMKHIAYDPYVTPESVGELDVELVNMDRVLAESDFLTINCPLNEGTRHLLGEKELASMKETAFLINTARGPIVDEGALIRALREGWIRGAGIDAFEQEPTQPENPLLKMDNVIVTPHALGWTDQMFIGQMDEIVEQVRQIVNGEHPGSLVNQEVWDRPAFQAKLEKLRA
ncbi:MAG: dehydrogenase [Dehalococcoidia bacterium]|nr:dehydrogenase [Dehalococcoidia bacterium]